MWIVFLSYPRLIFSKRWKSYLKLTRAGIVDQMCRQTILAKIKVDRVYYISVERDKAKKPKVVSPRSIRKEPTMANKTNTLTNAQAIERAITALQNFGSTDQELIKKLTHMHAMATKKRLSTESPEAKETRTVLMPATLEFMRKKGEPVSWRDVAENVRGITTSQKVSAVMKKLIASGQVTKEYDGRSTIYRLAE